MPEITQCPECEKKLRVPDHLIGKKVRCPRCSLMFLAQVEPEVVEEPPPVPRPSTLRSEAFSERRPHAETSAAYDDDEDERRPPSRRAPEEEDDLDHLQVGDEDDYPDNRANKKIKAWRGVRLGLNLVIVAGYVTLSTIGVAAIGMGVLLLTGASLLGAFAADPGNPTAGGAAAIGVGLIGFFLLIGLMLFAETGLRITGACLCMQVPASRKNSARGLAIAAFSCAAASLLLNIVGAGMSGVGSVGPSGMAALAFTGSGHVASQIGNLASLAGVICWLIFLRSLAFELRGPETAQRISRFIVTSIAFGGVGLVLFVVLVVVGIASAAGAARSGSAFSAVGTLGVFAVFLFLLGGLLALGWLALYVWYLQIMTQVRNLVDRRLAKM